MSHTLVVTRKGEIQRSLQSADAAKHIRELWSGSALARVEHGIRGALAGRAARCESVSETDGNRHWLFTFVPQGPDKVLLVAADDTANIDYCNDLAGSAFFDQVTGLPNLVLVERNLSKILPIRQREEGRAAVIYLQLESHGNSFDRLSKPRSDEVLQILAGRLESQLRGSNAFDVEALERCSIVARAGFKQFCVVLPDIETGDDAESVAHRLREMVEEPVAIDAGSVSFEPAVGISLFPQDGLTADALIDNAALAMEDARSIGTESYRMHSGTVKLRALQRQDLSSEIRAAIDRNDFSLRYLPIYDISEREPSIVALEALLRWPDSVRRQRDTAELISVATRTGLMPLISDWIISQAITEIAALHSQTGTIPSLSLNVSQQEYGEHDFAARLASVAERHGVLPSNVVLELSETTLQRDLRVPNPNTKLLREIGFRLRIEDFGAGRFAFATLAGDTIDSVKLDRATVTASVQDSVSNNIRHAAVSVASVLGLEIVAAGIETEETLALVRDLGISRAQGFFMCKPIDIESIVAMTSNVETERRQA
ncbi:MAG: phosphodiesterase [Pseudomonadota bacterium]